MDVCGFLPGPANKLNTDAADYLDGGEALAYGVGSCIAVVDMPRMKIATVLAGGHRGSNVTAVTWNPHHHSRRLRTASAPPLRLASGDHAGRVVVWDVGSSVAIAILDDALVAAHGRGDPPARPGVAALAWVTANTHTLAIATASGTLLIWDSKGATVVWKKEVSPVDGLHSMQVDPNDRQHLCLCGGRGALTVLKLVNPARDKVEKQTYRVDMGPSQSGKASTECVRCLFSKSPDLLCVLLPREVVIFDLELQAPAASTQLPGSRSAFRSILAGFGHASAGGAPFATGLDFMFCLHQDASLSLWQRQPGGLTYTMAAWHNLLPPPSRMSNNVVTVAICASAAVWRPPSEKITTTFAGSSSAAPDFGSTEVLLTPRSVLSACHVDGDDDARGTTSACEPMASSPSRGPSGSDASQTLSLEELAVALVTNNGQVLRWSLPLPFPPWIGAPTPLLNQAPTLGGVLSTLPSGINTFAACPVPLAVAGDRGSGSGPGGDAAVAIAAVTDAGGLEVATVRRGIMSPLSAQLTLSLGAHKDMVRGVRWLADSPRVVSFSSEKTSSSGGSSGWRNSLLLTDLRTRASTPFREVGVEAAPMLGVRASPGGAYLLLLLKGAPSEIWMVKAGRVPYRLRVLDLPFTAVEWALPAEAVSMEAPEGVPSSKWALFSRTPLSHCESFTSQLEDSTFLDTPKGDRRRSRRVTQESADPEERLAFALTDGRLGVLGVKGKTVTDTKPKRPTLGPLVSKEVLATAVAAWGPLVVFGDAEGNLLRWDTSNGRVTSSATGLGPVRRLHFSSPASPDIAFNPVPSGTTLARCAVLFAGGVFGVWELDAKLDLRQGHVTTEMTGKLGRVVDIAWTALPSPAGNGACLAAATDDGGIAFLDVSQTTAAAPRRARGAAFRAATGGVWPLPTGGLAAAPAAGCAALLPPPWALLLRLTVQEGVSTEALRSLMECGRRATPVAGQAERAAEEALWAALPPGTASAWQAARRDAAPLIVQGNGGRSTIDWDDARRGLVSPPSFRRTSEAGTSSMGSLEATAVAAAARRRSRLALRPTSVDDLSASGATSAAALKIPIRRTSELLPGNGEQGPRLAAVVASMAAARHGELLSPSEWGALGRAHSAANPAAARAELAAMLLGEEDEVQFWRRLPATLAAARRLAGGGGAVGATQGAEGEGQQLRQRPLWECSVAIAEARERVEWHHLAADKDTAPSAQMQERRMIELVALGDYHTAVGFLLASEPETSARYYRDALCTLALAHAAAAVPDHRASEGFVGSSPASSPGTIPAIGASEAQATGTQENEKKGSSNAATLLWQAAKVVTANAASVGDLLLGVPLLCSSGLPAEAVAVLQEGGLWRYAATLAAQLPPSAVAHTLDNWAGHIHEAEGRVWRAVGFLAAAGELGAAAHMLRGAALPDAAAAFVAVVRDAGLAGDDSGGLLSMHTIAKKTQSSRETAVVEAAALVETIGADFRQYVANLLAVV